MGATFKSCKTNVINPRLLVGEPLFLLWGWGEEGRGEVERSKVLWHAGSLCSGLSEPRNIPRVCFFNFDPRPGGGLHVLPIGTEELVNWMTLRMKLSNLQEEKRSRKIRNMRKMLLIHNTDYSPSNCHGWDLADPYGHRHEKSSSWTMQWWKDCTFDFSRQVFIRTSWHFHISSIEKAKMYKYIRGFSFDN